MKHALEPERMTDERRARGYARADVLEPNHRFGDQLVADFTGWNSC
jgi:hypothetical protein